jgi:Polycystin cation channel
LVKRSEAISVLLSRAGAAYSFITDVKSGGVLPMMDVQVVKLLKYNTVSDYFLMGTEILFMAFTLYYLIQECLEFRASGAAYFADLGMDTA